LCSDKKIFGIKEIKRFYFFTAKSEPDVLKCRTRPASATPTVPGAS